MSPQASLDVYHGRPCKRGHAGLRRVGNRDCVECARLRALKHGQQNVDAKRAYSNARYRANPDKHKAMVKGRRLREPDKIRAEKRAEYIRHSDAYKARARAWAERNLTRLPDINRKWRRANPEKVAADRAARRALRERRRPPWLTRHQAREIAALYQHALALTERTGIKHEVDHIVPLAGRNVSGLHVPWNLQVLTRAENRLKSNKFVIEALPRAGEDC